MGIDSRSWYRSTPQETPPPWRAGGRSGWGFTVNTWLIVICVAIFVVDGFLPTRLMPIGEWMIDPEFRDVPRHRIRVGETDFRVQAPAVDPRRPQPVHVLRELLDTSTGQRIGWGQMRPMHLLESYLFFSTYELIHGLEYWRVLGFQFLHDHSSIAHLSFNMLGLFFFGPIVERRLGGKRYLAFYLLCGIFGALTYLILNLLGMVAVDNLGWQSSHLPFLLVNEPRTPLIGASAGVYGVLMAGAYLVPHATVYLFFLIPIRFDRVAYLLLLVSVLSLAFSVGNAGGEAAHLGGALAGAYFIRRQHHLHGFFDVLGRVDPTSRSRRERIAARQSGTSRAPAPPMPPAGTAGAATRPPVGPSTAPLGGSRGAVAPPDGVELDRILAKISSQGMGSLTEAERRTLRAASGRER
jgi:membrane associated rhomboid family serine protease